MPCQPCCCSVPQLSYSLRPHELQHARLPCSSLSPGVCSNSCPLSQLCHPAISSSVVPFSSCSQPFPASGESFPMSQLFASGGQSIGASASASVLPVNSQGWFPLGWSGVISLWSPSRDSQESSPTPQFKSINSSALSLLYGPTLTSIHSDCKNHSLDYSDLCWQSSVPAWPCIQPPIQQTTGFNTPSLSSLPPVFPTLSFRVEDQRDHLPRAWSTQSSLTKSTTWTSLENPLLPCARGFQHTWLKRFRVRNPPTAHSELVLVGLSDCFQACPWRTQITQEVVIKANTYVVLALCHAPFNGLYLN